MRQNPAGSRLIPVSTLLLALVGCGGGGGGGSPPPPPPPDTTAPDTTIGTTIASPNNATTASISFSSNETGSTFETRLDGAAFAAATSPQALNNLADGSHTFEVRARDAAGNIDPTPASVTWTVDTVAPDTQLTNPPSGTVASATASVSFTSPDATATFEASLDNAAFAAVTSPYSVNALSEGAHTLRIRARDAAGNVDATPASATWTVSTTPPVAGIVFPPAISYTQSTTLTVRGSAQDADGVAEVRVNGVLATSGNGFAT